jgi:hypothetical protein
MDPISIAIMVGVPAVARLIGEAVASGDRQKADEIRKRAAAAFGDVALPQLDQEVAKQLGPSAYSKIQVDPTARSTQQRALQSLIDEGQAGGLTVEDRAAQEEAQNAANMEERAQRGAILQSAERRGAGGAGATLGSMMSAQQGAADRAYRGGLSAAAEARRRALQSLSEAGSLGGQMEDREYHQAADAARAADEREQWNAEALRHAAEYNNTQRQIQHENQMRKVGAQNSAQLGYADSLDGRADRTAGTAADIGSAAAQGYGAYYNGNQRRRRQQQVSPDYYQDIDAPQPY